MANRCSLWLRSPEGTVRTEAVDSRVVCSGTLLAHPHRQSASCAANIEPLSGTPRRAANSLLHHTGASGAPPHSDGMRAHLAAIAAAHTSPAAPSCASSAGGGGNSARRRWVWHHTSCAHPRQLHYSVAPQRLCRRAPPHCQSGRAFRARSMLGAPTWSALRCAAGIKASARRAPPRRWAVATHGAHMGRLLARAVQRPGRGERVCV